MLPPHRQALADRLDWLVDWLYPPRCRACRGRIAGRDSEYFCSACWSQIRLVSHPLCTVCGRPFLDASGDDHLCGVCLSRTPRFVSARAWACYPREEITEDPLRQVVQKFKRWRGFNQSVLLARQVSRAYGLPMDPFVLVRDKETSAQTQLSEEERRKNVRGAFSVQSAASLNGKTILLVDDVYTSGATVNECSRVLVQAGAKKVSVLTLARTIS